MPDHVYKHLELTGTSKISSDDAAQKAIAKAAKTVRGMRWFEVLQVRGMVDKNKVDYWQVSIRVGFTLED